MKMARVSMGRESRKMCNLKVRLVGGVTSRWRLAGSMMCAVTRTEGERVRMGRLSRRGCMKMCNLMGRLGVVLQLGSGTMVRNILEA